MPLRQKIHVEQLPSGLVVASPFLDGEPDHVIRCPRRNGKGKRRPLTTDERLERIGATEKLLRDRRRVRRLQRECFRRQRTPNGRHSLKRVRHWRMLRRWLRRPEIRSEDKHTVRTLLGQLARRKAPTLLDLPEYFGLKADWQQLLKVVVLCCAIRGAKAVEGTRHEWGQLIGRCGRTAWTYLEDLCELNWLEKLEQFRPGRSTGRDGKKLQHRQLCNLYRPGPLLREAFERYERKRSDEKSKKNRASLRGPDRGNFCQPSASGLPPASDLCNTPSLEPTSPASSAAPEPPSGAKVSASPTEFEGPPFGRPADSKEIKFHATVEKTASRGRVVAAPALVRDDASLAVASSVSLAPGSDTPDQAVPVSDGELTPEHDQASPELPPAVRGPDLDWVAAAGGAPLGSGPTLEEARREEEQRERQRLARVAADYRRQGATRGNKPPAKPPAPPPSEHELQLLEAESLDRSHLRAMRQMYLRHPENRELAVMLAQMSRGFREDE